MTDARSAPALQATIMRTTCRLCGAGELREVCSLGEQYVNDFVTAEHVGTGLRAPLDLVMCASCSLVQLRHTAPQELLYARRYWYRSGVTDTMRAALRDITRAIEEEVPLAPGDAVLDIGANDGTLLASYATPGLRLVGCEPAVNLLDALRTVTRDVIDDFWAADRYEALAGARGFGKARVVTAIGMFYDLDDPNQFIRDARHVLAADGIFVAQLMCLAPMLASNDVGNICHEHLEYYSLATLQHLFETNGLEMFRIEENDVNGGSYRIFARHATGQSLSLTERISLDDVLAFANRVEANRDRCVAFIRGEVANGKSVYVYGASTKGNVILQYYGLDRSVITAAAERSPEKWGRFTVGSWIPIVSEAEARAARPDYFLVLPWAFLDEFYEREHEWRAAGGKFIVPLPDFRVVP